MFWHQGLSAVKEIPYLIVSFDYILIIANNFVALQLLVRTVYFIPWSLRSTLSTCADFYLICICRISKSMHRSQFTNVLVYDFAHICSVDRFDFHSVLKCNLSGATRVSAWALYIFLNNASAATIKLCKYIRRLCETQSEIANVMN